MRRGLAWLPLLAFAVLALVAAMALFRPAGTDVRSAMVGKAVPAFDLPAMVPGKPGLSTTALRGRPYLLNIFASWCVPCVAEAPKLVRLRALGVPVIGVAVRDTPAAVQEFLHRNGDGYAAVGGDRASAVQLALGSSGVPETFVVGADGRVVLQHIGDVRDDDVEALAAAVRDAR